RPGASGSSAYAASTAIAAGVTSLRLVMCLSSRNTFSRWAPTTRLLTGHRVEVVTLLPVAYFFARYFLLIAAPTVYFGSTKFPSRTLPHWLSIMYASHLSNP